MNKTILNFSILLTILVFNGCSTKFNAKPITQAKLGTNTQKNIILQKNLGEVIVNQYDYTESEGILLLDEYDRDDFGGFGISVKKNSFAIKHIQKGTNDIFYCGHFWHGPHRDTDSVKVCFLEKGGKLQAVYTSYYNNLKFRSNLKKVLKYKNDIKHIDDKSSYRMVELLYDGIDNNVILFTYREYTNNIARPAFYRQIRYTLNKDGSPTLITYKSTKIKVIKATNTTIEYEILNELALY